MSNNTYSKYIIRFFLALAALLLIAPVSIKLQLLPLTLQTFVLVVIGYWFGIPGIAAAVVYVVLGLFGFPVFSGFTSNPEILDTISGGFVIAFPILTTLVVVFKSTLPKYYNAFAIFLIAHIGFLLSALLYNAISGFQFISFQFILVRFVPSVLLKTALASLLVKYVKLPKDLAF